MGYLTLDEAKALYAQGGRARNIALKHYSDDDLVNKYYSFDKEHMLTVYFAHDGYNHEKPLAILQGLADEEEDRNRFLILNPCFEMVSRKIAGYNAMGFVKK